MINISDDTINDLMSEYPNESDNIPADEQPAEPPVTLNEEFTKAGEVLATSIGSVGELDAIAVSLLQNSYDYFAEFVPQQVASIQDHIETVNKRLVASRDSQDMRRLTGALRELNSLYSETVERSIIGYMANYKPLRALVLSHHKKAVHTSISGDEVESVTPSTAESAQVDDDWDIDEGEMNDIYKPYTDSD